MSAKRAAGVGSPTPVAGPPYDAAVVGGGVAGLAAACWLARYRQRVIVLDAGDYRAAPVAASHGYLGRDPLRPVDLLADGRAELARYPTAEYRAARVTSARRDGAGVELHLSGAGRIAARSLVLATGVVDRFPAVSGFADHYGISAFHCPACDGYEAKDSDVVALGWDARLAGFAATLQTWARSVTVVTNGRRFEGDGRSRALLAERRVPVLESSAVALHGPPGDLHSVELSDGRQLPCGRLFFSLAHRPRTALAEALGCEVDEEGYVSVNERGRTSVQGVYAAGDLVPGLQLIQVAAATGVVAGVACAEWLLGL